MLLCGLAVAGCALASGAAGMEATASARWLVRDVAADSAFTAPGSDGSVKKLKLKLETKTRPGASLWQSTCTVISETPADRAVTLALSIPIDCSGGTWWDDPQRSRTIEGKKPFANLVADIGVGATGSASKYPLAVIAKGDKALVVAVPVDSPRLVSFVYDPTKREVRAEFDFGLSNVSTHFPSRADATVIVYEVPAKWAFRQALARYYELYPDAFNRRVKKAGIWLPFAPISKIERPEDFGILFHEIGVEHPDWLADDEKAGVDSYLYVEPMTDWREFRGEGDKPYEKWVSQLWEDALGGNTKSQATLTSGVTCDNGKRDLYLGRVAYTKAAPFGVNCDPDVPTSEWGSWQNKGNYEIGVLEKALGWTDNKPTAADGVYIDSMEGWGQLQNYDRSHWRASRYPLTFDRATRKVCLLNFWGNLAFTKAISEKLHAKGRLLMGNDAYFRFWQLAPYVDIPGREYTWFADGKWSPIPDENYLFFRSMSATKPYLMLMNNAYEDASHMEEYFQRSLFYGVLPSMFVGHTAIGEAAYFTNPEWYNRDRHLFLKYIPLIRKIDAAGWRPVPHADVKPDSIRVERYGEFKSGDLAFSLHNPTSVSQSIELTLSASELGLPKQVSAVEWITGKAVPVADGSRLRLQLPANGYAVIGVTAPK